MSAESIAGSWQRALADVTVCSADFDLGAEVEALRADDRGVGAVVSFVGTVREWHPDAHATLELEHYPGMTERSIAEIILEARERFDVRGVRVIHRVGRLAVGDQIVLVAVASAHRQQAFDCAAFLMDWLKTRAPFWKKESAAGEARWVDARESDDRAASRWGRPDASREGAL
jgi:molybdopterin synthase catalytic subunit